MLVSLAGCGPILAQQDDSYQMLEESLVKEFKTFAEQHSTLVEQRSQRFSTFIPGLSLRQFQLYDRVRVLQTEQT